MADGAQQSRTGAVGLGQFGGLRGLDGQPMAIKRDRGLGCERSEHATVRAGQNPPSQGQVKVGADGNRGVGILRQQARVRAADTDDRPGVGSPGDAHGAAFEEGDGEHPECLTDPIEHSGQRILAGDEATGQGGQGVGLGLGAGGLPGAARGDVHDHTDGGGDQDEHDDGEDVRRVAHVQRVQRFGEEPVGEQACRDRSEHGRVETADDGDADDHREVEQQAAGKVKVAPQPREPDGEGWQGHGGEDRPGNPTPGGEAAGEFGQPVVTFTRLIVRDDVDVDLSGCTGHLGGDASAAEDGAEPRAPARPQHELAGVLPTGELQQRMWDVLPDDVVVAAAEAFDQLTLLLQRRRGCADKTVAAGDVDSEQLAAGCPGGDAGTAPDQRLPLRPAGERDDDPFAGLPPARDAVFGPVGVELLVDLAGHPQQCQFA